MGSLSAEGGNAEIKTPVSTTTYFMKLKFTANQMILITVRSTIYSFRSHGTQWFGNI